MGNPWLGQNLHPTNQRRTSERHHQPRQRRGLQRLRCQHFEQLRQASQRRSQPQPQANDHRLQKNATLLAANRGIHSPGQIAANHPTSCCGSVSGWYATVQHTCGHNPIVVDTQLTVCYALSSMNVFDFYKMVTDSIASYLVFVAFMFAMYLMSSIFIAFCTEQFIKIVLSFRVPLVPQEPNSKQQ